MCKLQLLLLEMKLDFIRFDTQLTHHIGVHKVHITQYTVRTCAARTGTVLRTSVQ